MRDVFISYSNKDRDFVRRLTSNLEVAGIRVFFDEMLKPGDSWQEVIYNAIKGARFMLLVLSPDYLQLQWAQAEWTAGLAREFEQQVRVIPLLARECRLDGLLATKVYVDFTKDHGVALQHLVAALQESGPIPDLQAGSAPGNLAQEIEPAELAQLRAELREAVTLFKATPSRGEDLRPVSRPRSAGRHRCFITMPFGDPELQVVY